MKRLYQLGIALLIFLIPSNLFYVLTEAQSRVHGLQIDYLLPKIHSSDFVIVTLIVLWLSEKKWLSYGAKIRRSRLLQGVLVLGSILLIRQYFTAYPLIAFWTSFNLLKMALLAYVLWQKRTILTSSFSYTIIAITVLFQSLVAFWQWFTQSSVAGYWFLGETNVSSYAGLAKTTLGGIDRVLPYGTTAHPNVLAGFVAVSCIILLFRKKKASRHTNYLLTTALVVGCATVLLTQSISAILALLIGAAIYFFPEFFKKISKSWMLSGILLFWLLSIFLPVKSENTSLIRRQYLNRGAVHMVVDHTLFGVGVQQFTTQIESYSTNREVVRFVQPAHNVPLLFLVETGILGVLFLWLVTRTFRKKTHLTTSFLILVPLLFLDHYLLTLQTGLLTALLFALYSREISP